MRVPNNRLHRTRLHALAEAAWRPIMLHIVPEHYPRLPAQVGYKQRPYGSTWNVALIEALRSERIVAIRDLVMHLG